MESPFTAKGAAGLAQGGGFGFGGGPQRHAARPPSASAAFTASSRSEKGQHFAADILAGLMALARDHQHIAGLQRGDAGADGLGAVADFARAGRGGQNFLADGGGDLRCGDCRR